MRCTVALCCGGFSRGSRGIRWPGQRSPRPRARRSAALRGRAVPHAERNSNVCKIQMHPSGGTTGSVEYFNHSFGFINSNKCGQLPATGEECLGAPLKLECCRNAMLIFSTQTYSERHSLFKPNRNRIEFKRFQFQRNGKACWTPPVSKKNRNNPRDSDRSQNYDMLTM